MRIFVAIVSLIALAGCDKPVQTYADGPTRIEIQRVGCSHMGFCMGCGLDFQGKISCGPRHRPFCPGTQQAKVSITPIVIVYESGDVRNRDRREVLERMGACL